MSDQAFLIAGGSAAGSEQRREAVSTALFTESDEAVVIHLFATRVDCRRRGHGSRLLELLERHAHPKPVFVEAVPRAGNRAPEFWERRKFGELITVGPGGPIGRWYPASGVYGKVGSWVDGKAVDGKDEDEEMELVLAEMEQAAAERAKADKVVAGKTASQCRGGARMLEPEKAAEEALAHTMTLVCSAAPKLKDKRPRYSADAPPPPPKKQRMSKDKEYIKMEIRVPQSLTPGSICKIQSPDGQNHFVRIPPSLVTEGDHNKFVKRLPRKYEPKHLRDLDVDELTHWMKHRKIDEVPAAAESEDSGLAVNLAKSDEWLIEQAKAQIMPPCPGWTLEFAEKHCCWYYW